MDEKLRDEVTRLHAQVCSALGDPNRILIIYALNEGGKNVGELAEVLCAPQPTVSRHLKTLRESGIVKAQRNGQSICYTITDGRVVEALDLLRSVLADSLENRASLAQAVNQSLI
jgi:DNA-binding transcriptional ArsR family regulator